MNFVQRARAELCLTQEQFAERMSVPTQEQVAIWEAGKSMPSKPYREKMMPLAARHLMREIGDRADTEEGVALITALID